MKVFQFDGNTAEFDVILDQEISEMDTACLGDLSLERRLDALEARVEVSIDQWMYPATNRTYYETPGGTWIMQGRYGRMDFVIAAHPTNDLQANSDLHRFCADHGLIDLGEDEEDHQGEMGCFVAANVEGHDQHVIWVAYFRSEPTSADFGVAYENIRLGEGPEMEPESPEEIPNALSRQMGLRRYYIGQAI